MTSHNIIVHYTEIGFAVYWINAPAEETLTCFSLALLSGCLYLADHVQ